MRSTVHTLDSSSQKIEDTKDKYNDYDIEQKRAQKLVKNLVTQEKKNILWVYGSFWLFIAVVVWIWSRRMLWNKFLYYVFAFYTWARK